MIHLPSTQKVRVLVLCTRTHRTHKTQVLSVCVHHGVCYCAIEYGGIEFKFIAFIEYFNIFIMQYPGTVPYFNFVIMYVLPGTV